MILLGVDGWRPTEVRKLTLADFWLVLASRRLRIRMESGLSDPAEDRRTWGRLMEHARHAG